MRRNEVSSHQKRETDLERTSAGERSLGKVQAVGFRGRDILGKVKVTGMERSVLPGVQG